MSATGDHGHTFEISNAEHEDLAREEYDHVLEELSQQEGVTEQNVSDFEKSASALLSIALSTVKD